MLFGTALAPLLVPAMHEAENEASVDRCEDRKVMTRLRTDIDIYIYI